MSTTTTFNGIRSTRLRALRPFLSIAVLLLGEALYLPLREWIIPIAPLVAVIAGFAAFLLPGLMVAIYLVPEDSWVERIPLAVMISVAMLSFPSFFVLIRRSNMHEFIALYLGITILTAIVIIYLSLRRGVVTTQVDRETILPILILFCLGGGILVYLITRNMPIVGDDWVYFPWFWQMKAASHIMAESPYHGVALTPNIRQEFYLILISFGFMNFVSGVDPILYYVLLRPILAIVAVAAFYSVARSTLQRRNLAAFATAVWIVILMLNLQGDRAGYHLVVRIAQDKFFVRFILIPIALRLLLDFFNKGEWRYLILFGIASWAVGTTHPIGPAQLGLACAAFGLFQILLKRDRKTFGRVLLVGVLIAVGMIVPAYQLIGAQDSSIALSLGTSAIDPNYNNRVRLATRALRLLFFENGKYILHPSIFWERMSVTLIVLPLWLWKARKDVAARLLLATFGLIVLFYIPQTAMLLGKFVTPWLLWRVAWVPELGSWLLLTATAALLVDQFVKGFEKFRDFLTRRRKAKPALAPVTVNTIWGLAGVLLLAAVVPNLQINYLAIKDIWTTSQTDTCKVVGPALKILADQVQSDVMVLSNRDVDFCIPAYSPWTKVVEYRGNATLTRFANDNRLDEAWQRMEDEAYYSAATFIDQGFEAILERENIQYIVIQSDRLLNLQLENLPAWFTMIGQANGYRVYRVERSRPPLPIVDGYTFLKAHDFQKAEANFRSALGKTRSENILGLLGLSQLSAERGNIADAVSYLEQAVQYQNDALTYAWLGATYVAANQLPKAVEAFGRAHQLMPDSINITLLFAQANKLEGKPDETLALFDQAARLTSTPDSANYYRVIAGYFVGSQMYPQAIDAYRKGLELNPTDPYFESLIGNIYFTEGDFESAKRTYESELSHSRWQAEPMLGLGQIYGLEGNKVQAIEEYRQGLILDPTNSLINDLLASTLVGEYGVDQAIQDYKDTLSYRLVVPASQKSLADLLLDQNQKNVPDAINLYKQAMFGDATKMGVYWTYIAEAESQRQNYNESIADYIKSDDLGGSPVQVHIGLGSKYKILGKLAESRGQYLETVQAVPYSDFAHVSLGTSYRGTAEWTAALKELNLSVRLGSQNAANYNALGGVYEGLGRWQDAQAQYQKAIEVQPILLDGYLNLGRVYQNLGELDQAKAILQQATAILPHLDRAWSGLGDYYQAAGDYKNAIAQYQKAIEVEPENITPYYEISDLYLIQGNIDESIKILQSATANVPDDVTIYDRLADDELVRSNADAALSWLQKGIQAVPDSGVGYIQLADEYRRRGDYNNAIAMYQKASQVDPLLTDAYNKSATLYRDLGQFQAAEKQYSAGYAAVLYSNASLLGLGDLYLLEGQTEKAQQTYQIAANNSPTSANAFLGISKVQKILGDRKGAIETLISGTKVLPGTIDSFLNLGSLYIELGDLDKARETYEQAISVNPTSPAAYLGLSNVYKNGGDLEKARQALEDAITHNPTAYDAYLNLASFLENQGDTEQAETYYLKELAVAPILNTVYLNLGQFYQRQERYEEALEVLKKALTFPPNTSALYIAIGNVYSAQKQPDLALKWYQDSIQLNYTDTSPYLWISNFYQDKEDWKAAEEALDKGLAISPINAGLLSSLANVDKILGRVDKAIDEYQTVCRLDPVQPDCHISIAGIETNLGERMEAIKELEKAIYLAPTELTAYQKLGEVYLTYSLYPEAESIYTQGMSHSYDKVGARLARAGFYSHKGDWDKARQDYELAWLNNPTSQAAGNALAQFLIHHGDETTDASKDDALEIPGAPVEVEKPNWEKGLDILVALTQLPDASASNYISIGDLYASRANWSQATIAYNRAIQMDQSSVLAYTGLARVYEQQGQPETALVFYQAATIGAPDDPLSFLYLGDAYLARLDFSAAQAAYQQVLVVDPNSTLAITRQDNLSLKMGSGGIDLGPLEARAKETPSFWLFNTLGNQYQQRGEWDTALDWYLKAVRAEPYNSDGYYAVANNYRPRSQFDQALPYLLTALRYEPEDPDVLLALGSVQNALGMTTTAQTTYSMTIAADPSLESGYIALANFYSSQEDYETAIQILDQGLKADPGSSNIYMNLGQTYANIGDYQTALQKNQEGLDLIPGSATLYQSRGNILNTQITQIVGGLDTAEANYLLADFWLNLAKEIQKENNYRPWTNLFVENYESGYWDAKSKYDAAIAELNRSDQEVQSAKEAYQQAISIQPDNVFALVGLGSFLSYTDSPEAGLPYYEEAVAKNPTLSYALNALGKVYLDLDRPEDALRVYQQGLKYSPGNIGSMFGVIRAYGKLGDFDAATAALALEYGQTWWSTSPSRLRSNP